MLYFLPLICVSVGAKEPTPLFDGKSLKGWSQTVFPKGHVYNGGQWKIKEGSIVATRPKGDRRGSWLSTKENYGDFELQLEVNPDWGCDTGVLLRHNGKGAGIQVSIDYRNGGNVGFIHGQGSGSYYTRPWSLTGEIEEGALGKLKAEEHYDAEKHDGLLHACSGREFLKAWKIGEWNHLRIRCVGSHPDITVWVNGLKTCDMRSDRFKAAHPLKKDIPPYDAKAVHDLLGDSGMIGLQIHPGKNWRLPDGKCRYRNLRITKVTNHRNLPKP
jgi:hypothetical protein